MVYLWAGVRMESVDSKQIIKILGLKHFYDTSLDSLRSVDFGSIQIMNCLLNDDAEEVIGTRSSQVIYCLLTSFRLITR